MSDNTNHPKHYKGNKLEVIEVIDDFNLNFALGNVVKYILRAGKKATSNRIEDLQKAQWYLNHEIEKCIVRKKANG